MADNERFILGDLAEGAAAACERIRRAVGVISRIYEDGIESDRWFDGWRHSASRRAVAVALAELAAEIPELTPREVEFAIRLLRAENDRARGTTDFEEEDWNGQWLDELERALRDQHTDLDDKVRLFGLMSARHDARR